MDADGLRQAQYNMRPTTHRYFFWTDDKQGKFCHCEECSGYSESEQALIYENRLLALLREYDPQATLAHLAYHQTMVHPVKVRADEGVFVEFAPISRDYSQPLPEESAEALNANLLAFPAYSQHILEYWLDESMFSHWKRDLATYRGMGAADITSFATWLYGDYVALYGSTETIFKGYGESFSEPNEHQRP